MVSDYSSWLNGETITFDGGEFNALAGELMRSGNKIMFYKSCKR